MKEYHPSIRFDWSCLMELYSLIAGLVIDRNGCYPPAELSVACLDGNQNVEVIFRKWASVGIPTPCEKRPAGDRFYSGHSSWMRVEQRSQAIRSRGTPSLRKSAER